MTTEADKKIIREALDRYALCEEAEATQRSRMRDDIRFAAGEQWDEQIKHARENDPNGPRPCLTMDKLGQYRRQVVNDARQNKPAIKVRPVDSGADPEVAEILQGVVRHIEDVSTAEIAYDTALDSATGPGVGYVRVLTKIIDKTSGAQDIEIAPVHNVFSVYLDPDHKMPDGSDSQYGFVVDDMPRKKFEASYPKAKTDGWSADDSLGWTEKDTVRVCEYFRIVESSENLLVLADGQEMAEEQYWELYAADEARPQVTGNVTNETRRVEWFKLTASEILDRTDIPCRWIPIVEVIGNEDWIDGKRQLTGMTYWAADAQKAYNYARSAFVEQIALAPKIPYIAAAGQVEDFEDEWRNANRSAASVLRYNPVDINGTMVPAPQRQMAPQPSAGWQAEMQTSERDIQSALGMYAASLGNEGQEKSGRAILARQKEGDTSTFHYIDNLSRAIRHVGRILIDMIPQVYDTRRVTRIIGQDGESQQATIDPQLPQPFAKVRDEQTGKIKRIYNPTIGKYDVSVSVGPSYNTRRMEAAESMTEALRANPAMFPLIGDLWVSNMDWPNAEAIAKRLKMALPPEIREAEDEDGEQSPEVLQAVAATKQQYEQQIGQMLPQVQAMQQQLQEVTQERDQLAQERSGKVIEAQVKGAEIQAKSQESQTSASLAAGELQLKAQEIELKSREVAIKEFEAETRRIAEQNRQLEILAQAQAPQPPQDGANEVARDDSAMTVAPVLQAITQQLAMMQQCMLMGGKMGVEKEAEEGDEVKEIVIQAPNGGTYRGQSVGGKVTIIAPSGQVYNGSITEH